MASPTKSPIMGNIQRLENLPIDRPYYFVSYNQDQIVLALTRSGRTYQVHADRIEEIRPSSSKP